MFPSQWVRNITEECYPGTSRTWRVGDIVRHPDGYMVEITGGQFWGDFGLSNFWYWKRLDNGEPGCGYGW